MDDIEHLAYRFRVENSLFDLPLTYDDVLKTAKAIRITVEGYDLAQEEMIRYGLYPNSLNTDAFVTKVSEDEQARIYFDDTKTPQQKRDMLLHEIGHILNGHVELGTVINLDDKRFYSEREAEKFRLYVTAPPRAVKERGGKSVKRIKEITLLNDDDSELVAQMVKELPYRPACDDEKQLISLMRSTRAYKRYRLNALTRLFCGLLTAMIAITIPVMGMAVVAEKIVAPPLADPYTTTCDPMRTMDDQLRDFQEISDSVYITKDNYLFHLIGCPDLRGTEKMRVDIGEAIDGDYFPCPDCVLQSEQYEWLNK